MYRRDPTDSACDAFVSRYNSLAAEAAKAESESNAIAADKHIEVGSLVAKFHDEYGRSLSNADKAFLRSETVARCMQTLLLRSVELSGFGDIALSLGEKRKLQRDLANAKKRLDALGNGDGDVEGDDESYSTVDPRKPNALYEFTPWEELNTKLTDLPGYERQHREMTKAYFVLSDSSDSQSAPSTSNDSQYASSIASGSNMLLHGPPGTGKTTAAMALAKSLGLDYVFANVENLLSAYRSESEKNLRSLYARMRALTRVRNRNVVLLMDEVDGLVKSRTTGTIGNADYSLLARFLTILEPNDAKTNNSSICSVFTTNRVDNLDDAFRRRCSEIFFGRLNDAEARTRLCKKFFERALTTNANNDEIRALANGACEKWVSGDYVRFDNESLQPFRLDMYLTANNTNEDAFFNHLSEISGTNRRITIPLPKINAAIVRDLAKRYETITSDKIYNELYAKYS